MNLFEIMFIFFINFPGFKCCMHQHASRLLEPGDMGNGHSGTRIR